MLYFDNLSGDTADAYLADGLTEELIARLGQVQRLALKSRNAVRRFRGAAADDPAALGRALGVTHLVSGSVRRSGRRLRVTVELIRAVSGVRLWGDQYTRTDADLLAIEEDIAIAVTAAVAGRLLPAERASLAARPTRNPLAYDRYLRGNYHLARRTPHGLRRAIGDYQAASRLDPALTAALARTAFAYALHLDWEWPYGDVPRDTLLVRGLAAADLALAQDSAASDAWLARGWLLTRQEPRTYAGVLEALRRAIALNPDNAEAHHFHGVALNRLGDPEGATMALHRALELDPERAITLYNLGLVNLGARRFGDAVQWMDSALATDSTFYQASIDRARARLQSGDTARAGADAQAALRLAPAESRHHVEGVLALLEARLDDSVAARARAERLIPRLPNGDSAAAWSVGPRHGHSVGLALAGVGERDRALDVLERITPRGAQLSLYLRSPEYDPLRTHPRFQRLVEESRPR